MPRVPISATAIYDAGFDEETDKTISAETCPECDGTIVSEGGEIRCTEWGLIVNEYWIDHGPEWSRSDGTETKSERTWAPVTPTRHDRGLSTEIGL